MGAGKRAKVKMGVLESEMCQGKELSGRTAYGKENDQ